MLKVRVIPTMLYKDVGLVKGVNFDSWRRTGSLIQAVKVYNLRGVDELIFLDISATKSKKEPDYELVSAFSSECFVPLTVGGGITSTTHVKKLLAVGADKISVNSYALENPHFITEVAKEFGSQCIVVSIDVKKDDHGNYRVYSHSGTKETNIDLSAWVKEVENRGAGEILITSIDKDGTMQGYDLELIKSVTSITNIPVIASGGAGHYKDFVEVVNTGGACAVAAASIFHFTEQTPLEARKYMMKNGGIPTRLDDL